MAQRIFDVIRKGTSQDLHSLLVAHPNAHNLRGEGIADSEFTPLQYAIRRKKRRQAEMLLQHGADPDARGRDNRTAFNEAERLNDAGDRTFFQTLLEEHQRKTLAPKLALISFEKKPPRDVVQEIARFLYKKREGGARKSRRRVPLNRKQWTRRRG